MRTFFHELHEILGKKHTSSTISQRFDRVTHLFRLRKVTGFVALYKDRTTNISSSVNTDLKESKSDLN